MKTNGMKHALMDAGYGVYSPSRHAIDRARLRFGIQDTESYTWFNKLMKKAIPVTKTNNDTRQTIYSTEYSGETVYLVADAIHKHIKTVYTRTTADFLRPTLEREKRKLRREYVRKKRQLELVYAELLQEIGEMAVNRARARNPQTRELIADRMTVKQRQADEIVEDIERLDDEHKRRIRTIDVIASA